MICSASWSARGCSHLGERAATSASARAKLPGRVHRFQLTLRLALDEPAPNGLCRHAGRPVVRSRHISDPDSLSLYPVHRAPLGDLIDLTDRVNQDQRSGSARAAGRSPRGRPLAARMTSSVSSCGPAEQRLTSMSSGTSRRPRRPARSIGVQELGERVGLRHGAGKPSRMKPWRVLVRQALTHHAHGHLVGHQLPASMNRFAANRAECSRSGSPGRGHGRDMRDVEAIGSRTAWVPCRTGRTTRTSRTATRPFYLVGSLTVPAAQLEVNGGILVVPLHELALELLTVSRPTPT